MTLVLLFREKARLRSRPKNIRALLALRFFALRLPTTFLRRRAKANICVVSGKYIPPSNTDMPSSHKAMGALSCDAGAPFHFTIVVFVALAGFRKLLCSVDFRLASSPTGRARLRLRKSTAALSVKKHSRPIGASVFCPSLAYHFFAVKVKVPVLSLTPIRSMFRCKRVGTIYLPALTASELLLT